MFGMTSVLEQNPVDAGEPGRPRDASNLLRASSRRNSTRSDNQARLFGLDGIQSSRNGRIQSASPMRTRAGVEYRPLPCKTLLNESKDDSLPFSWTINPYRGCEFACQYCFARATHSYLDHDPKDFERRIYVKQGAADVLRRQLRPELLQGRTIAIGTATDPYQGAERHFRITRGILETLARIPNLSLTITTKSPLVARDLDLLREIDRQGRVRVNISMTTLRPGLARILEPRAPVPRRRIETIQRVSEAGISTAIFCMPILPGITDRLEDLKSLLGAARAAGACHAFGSPLHLETPIRPTFLPMLRRHFPQLYGHYQDLYRGSRYAPRQEAERIDRIFAAARDAVGFSNRTERSVEKIGSCTRVGPSDTVPPRIAGEPPAAQTTLWMV
jgi:DNA repair photolyase